MILELDEFLQDLDEDVEGMQSTIYFLQNELQKTKASVQSTINTKINETNSKAVVNGIKNDDVIDTETPLSTSKTETSTQLIETKPDNKLNKHEKPKDSKQSNDIKSNQPKVKKTLSTVAEGTDKSEKNLKVHKSKHKSDGNKKEEKRIKSEKRNHSKDEVVPKKSKNDKPISTEVKPPVAEINGLPNGS